jgi:hypothetical protein
MFEWLKSQGLPGFTRQNWQSRIRHFVSQHPEYSDIGSWSGTESADIVYDDSESRFTSLLIENGYLNRDIWADRRPTYYIEVKTSTSFLQTPFYVSQNQYDSMDLMMLSEEEASDEVYMIARVFCLGLSTMGLKFYLDPSALRCRGLLEFRTTDKYEVTPPSPF